MPETRDPLVSKQVEIGRIESEVNSMWEQATNASGLLPPVMRACVMNLIVYAPDKAGADAVNATLAPLVARHPSRVILMRRNGEETAPHTEAWVAAVCQSPQPGIRQICCEEITLIGHGEAAEELHSTVLGILQRDVPVVLWWRAEPNPESTLFHELADAADYVILDSAYFSKPFALWSAVRKEFPLTTASDLNWARIRPWRELVAQFFDRPETIGLLPQIEKVSLTYSAQGANRIPTQAFLLTGWLSTRLGWQFDAGKEIEPGNFDLQLHRGTQPIHVEIRSQEAGYARTGRLLGCSIETVPQAAVAGQQDSEAAGCEFVVTRRVKEDLIHTRMYLLDRGELACATSLEIRQEHELLMSELERPGRHPILEATLEYCAEMWERL